MIYSFYLSLIFNNFLKTKNKLKLKIRADFIF